MPALALGSEWRDAKHLITPMGEIALGGLALIIVAERALLSWFSLLVTNNIEVAIIGTVLLSLASVFVEHRRARPAARTSAATGAA